MIASSKNMRPLPPLSLRQLQYFVSVARTGNFTETAEQMAVTQPALSTSIRQMEGLLGGALFNRTSHPVSLTELGREVLPLAEHLLETADATFSSMKDSSRLSQGIVRLSLLPASVGRVIPALATIAQTTPAARFEIRDVIHPTLANDVLTGVSDIGIGVPCGDPRLLERPLLTDTLGVVMRDDHPLAQRHTIPWSLLNGEKVAMFQRGDIADWLGPLAEAQQVPQVTAAYRTEYLESLCELVRARLAVTILPTLYEDMLFDPRLVIRPLVEPTINRQIVALRRVPPVRSAAVDACFEALCLILTEKTDASM
ncbi:DNA-binding transcriptional regulator, LysR family [Burkholderia sp. D7]|nr:DNA-binding transcriptional regulator, LysR family [Burkholderia sp. D7]